MDPLLEALTPKSSCFNLQCKLRTSQAETVMSLDSMLLHSCQWCVSPCSVRLPVLMLRSHPVACSMDVATPPSHRMECLTMARRALALASQACLVPACK